MRYEHNMIILDFNLDLILKNDTNIHGAESECGSGSEFEHGSKWMSQSWKKNKPKHNKQTLSSETK